MPLPEDAPALPEIVDSHCHLDFPDFEGELPRIIASARAAGVRRMVTICTKLHNAPTGRAIAEAHEGVFYAVGRHPMSVAEAPPEPAVWAPARAGASSPATRALAAISVFADMASGRSWRTNRDAAVSSARA